MLFLSSVGLLTFVLLSGPAQAETPSFVECESASPRVDLMPELKNEKPPKACISANIATVLMFNTDINRDSVAVQGRERFESFEVTDRVIVLKPKSTLMPGERFLLTVTFRDGASPMDAAFLLIAHPALATRQIDVFRRTRSAEAYRQEAQEAWAEVTQLKSRVKQLEGQVLTKGGLMDLLANGLVDFRGVAAHDLTGLQGRRSDTLDVGDGISLFAACSSRVALSLPLSQSSPLEWSLKEIFLTDDHGGVFKPLTWLGCSSIPSDGVPCQLLLEWQFTSTEDMRPFTLVLVGADGRTARVSKIVFPH
jgi:uncharacterized protein (TIGR02268 family)